ncbi:MAG: hypothetical protein K6U80_06290 [Firmicutes bacterium]|nr:hypothetical protein [Bacillota bacterium]
MKIISVFLLVCSLTLGIAINAMGAILLNEDNMLTDTWYGLDPPPGPHYRAYSYVPYTNSVYLNSEFYYNDHSFVLISINDEQVDVATNIKASILFPVGVFYGIKAVYGDNYLTRGIILGSLGYRWNLNDQGYLAFSIENARGQENIVYALDGEFLSDSFKITGDVHCSNNGTSAILQGRVKVNDNLVAGIDIDTTNEGYYIGLTWKSSAYMIFDGKAGIHSNNFHYALSQTFKIGKHQIGLEYEKLASEEGDLITLKQKYLLSDTSELVIKAGFGKPILEGSPYGSLCVIAYQMNL